MSELELEQLFTTTIDKLKAGKRPMLKLPIETIESLNNQWKICLQNSDDKMLFKILCILDNSQTLNNLFFDVIKETLLNYSNSETKILVLGVARKHIIEHAHQRGERVHYDFILVLKELLTTKHPEVLEWTLRLVESLGNQSIILKEDVLKRTPGISAIFDGHKKASKQIIELLQKRWER